MKFGIQSRLFVAIIATIALAIMAMALAVNWSFERGFVDYLRQVELERLDPLRKALAEAYGRHGNWTFLRHQPRVWRNLLEQGLQEFEPSSVNSAPREDWDRFPPPPSRADAAWRPRPVGPPPRLSQSEDGAASGPRRGPPPRLAQSEDGAASGPRRGPPPRLAQSEDGAASEFPSEPPRGRFAGPGAPMDRPPPVPPPLSRRGQDSLTIEGRLRLLDHQHAVVFGPPGPAGAETLRPILLQGEPVGYLALRDQAIRIDALAQSFQAGQRQTYLIIAAWVVLLSGLSSLYLARRLIQPIRLIADAAHALGGGDYETRVQLVRGDELGRLAGDFNQLARDLARNERLRRQWIADISHELRTPLAVLRGEIEAIQDAVREATPERVSSLHAEVMSLSKLVDDLYQLALSDSGALDYKREPLELAELLDDALQAFSHRFSLKGLGLISRVTPPVPLIGDARRLNQLFGNLLENSQRYTDPGGRLEITLERWDAHYRLLFQDTAPGVPEDALEHLFERLYRVDKSRSRSSGGAGLGLALCLDIVHAHGGRMQAGHSPLGGLRVAIDLPAPAREAEGRSR